MKRCRKRQKTLLPRWGNGVLYTAMNNAISADAGIYGATGGITGQLTNMIGPQDEYYKKRNANINTVRSIGSGVLTGAGAGAVGGIPGVVIGGLVGGTLGGIKSLRQNKDAIDQHKQDIYNQMASDAQLSYNNYIQNKDINDYDNIFSTPYYGFGGYGASYSGNKHDDISGGIPINSSGYSTYVNGGNVIGLVEGGEAFYKNKNGKIYIFSNRF